MLLVTLFFMAFPEVCSMVYNRAYNIRAVKPRIERFYKELGRNRDWLIQDVEFRPIIPYITDFRSI